MKMRLFSLSFLFAVLLLYSNVEAQTIINFDNLGNNVEVTNQYPEATFSSTGGYTNWTTAQNLGSSLPNFICTGPTGGGINCAQPTYIDFTNPVYNLTFLGVGINDTETVAQVRVFVNGSPSSTVDVIGQGNPNVPVTVNLSAFQNVTRIEIINITDSGGIGWDDFTFDVGGTSVSIPTMTEWGMIIFIIFAGIASVYSIRRQRVTR